MKLNILKADTYITSQFIFTKRLCKLRQLDKLDKLDKLDMWTFCLEIVHFFRIKIYLPNAINTQLNLEPKYTLTAD